MLTDKQREVAAQKLCELNGRTPYPNSRVEDAVERSLLIEAYSFVVMLDRAMSAIEYARQGETNAIAAMNP